MFGKPSRIGFSLSYVKLESYFCWRLLIRFHLCIYSLPTSASTVSLQQTVHVIPIIHWEMTSLTSPLTSFACLYYSIIISSTTTTCRRIPTFVPLNLPAEEISRQESNLIVQHTIPHHECSKLVVHNMASVPSSK